MKEFDWKAFRQIKENAMQLFCNNALTEFEEFIKDKNENLQETYRLVINRDKYMVLLFDGKAGQKLIYNYQRYPGYSRREPGGRKITE